MKHVTHPAKARGALLSAVAMVAALVALLALAPFASAASDPVASGSTTITLNKALYKKLKKSDVKVLKVKPATVKGKKITLPINPEESKMDPTTGAGLLNHSGGFKFKAGKKSVVIKNLVLDTTKKSLSGKVGKKKIKIAAVGGVSITREGFGLGVIGKQLKLTKNAAKQLNKALDENVFKANKSLGSATAKEQPKTVTITGGSTSLAIDLGAVKRLENNNVALKIIPPTTLAKAGVFTFPVTGGEIAPDASSGVVQTGGGLTLVQEWPAICDAEGKAKTTTMTLNAIWVDLGAKTASVEVTVESTVDPKANLGVLGRSSIADVSLTGATVNSDTASHTVVVSGATATLQAVTAETLNQLFFEVAKKFKEGGCPVPGLDPQSFAAGDQLGSFAMTVNTQ